MLIKEYLETKVVDSCDVLVCGGGFAGISDDFTRLDISVLQSILEENGVFLHERDLK